MKIALHLALDIIREASARRWFLAFAVVLTLINLAVLVGLRMDVVDGALAATRLFGSDVGHDIRAADVVLRSVFRAATYAAYYGGLCFGILACSDFGPELFAPGRIEHLLSLPIRRIELLIGTFLGVLALCLLGTSYGAGVFFLILALKSGVWTIWPLLGAYLAAVAFFAIYASMLMMAIFARSASLSAAAGGLVFVLGIIAGQRRAIEALLSPGFSRDLFMALSAPLPRVSELADAAAAIAVQEPAPEGLGRSLLGTLAFGLSMLSVGAWRFENKDF